MSKKDKTYQSILAHDKLEKTYSKKAKKYPKNSRLNFLSEVKSRYHNYVNGVQMAEGV